LAYNSVQIIRDVVGNPVPQYYNTVTGQFEALQGVGGANYVQDGGTLPTNVTQAPAGVGLTGLLGAIWGWITNATGFTTYAPKVAAAGSSSLPAGGQHACTNTGAAIASSQACSEVLLQADPGNTVNVAVGGTGGQFIIMAPGSTMTIPVANVSTIFAKYVTSGTANLNYQPRS
jgi:hypothetical protein